MIISVPEIEGLWCKGLLSELQYSTPPPELLVHSRGDRAVDIAEGNKLAVMMANSEFTMLDDENPIFLPDTCGVEQALSAMERFSLARLGLAKSA